MGITTLTDQDNNLSTALGGLTHGVTPLWKWYKPMAYSLMVVLFNRCAIVKIVGPQMVMVEENSIQEKRVVDEKDAAIITSMLELLSMAVLVVKPAIGRPAAGKQVQQTILMMFGLVGYTPILGSRQFDQ